MKKNKIIFVSPLLLAGVLVILIPIFTFMTMERLGRQNEFITQKLLDQGKALIRTFEAGTRTGMFTMRWGANRIQTMLQETAIQPEIEYIMIVSKTGTILAHSIPDQVGNMFEDMPVIDTKESEHFSIYHRIKTSQNGVSVFEVFKQFVPIRKPFGGRMRRMYQMPNQISDQVSDQISNQVSNQVSDQVSDHRSGRISKQMAKRMPGQLHEQMMPGEKKGPDKEHDLSDWSQHYFEHDKRPDTKLVEHYIFVGLSMEKGQALKNRLFKETIFRSLILFLLGLAGLLILFAFQAYRNARASLSTVKAFSDNVIQNMPSGLVTLDQEYAITSINHAAHKMIGQNLKYPFPEWVELIKKIVPSHPVISQKIDLKKDDNKIIRLEITASFIDKDASNGFLLLFRDLSQIQELQKQVEINKRLAAIGKLAAGVAHEIRNPLSSIKGFATYFAKRLQDDAADQETANIMIGEVERINRSITQLLEFSKPMAIEKKQVNLKEMINHTIRLVRHDLEQKKIDTQVKILSREQDIFTDPDRMNQVFLNLYINAIEALPQSGKLEVIVQDIKLDMKPDIKSGMEQDSESSESIEIQIKDNGSGMDESTMDRIFDPYFTTKATGTGLGLSIVHRIIENLNGTIQVQSWKEKGTCFTICLPVHSPAENKM